MARPTLADFIHHGSITGKSMEIGNVIITAKSIAFAPPKEGKSIIFEIVSGGVIIVFIPNSTTPYFFGVARKFHM
ncbi:MAG: hypothetical protein LBJ59_05405 [Zoogloeaceae bacterium]|nr:hypothetical protein [Zoogloeaceae bacterium]